MAASWPRFKPFLTLIKSRKCSGALTRNIFGLERLASGPGLSATANISGGTKVEKRSNNVARTR